MPRPRKPASPFRYFNSSPEVIRLVVLMYVRFPLSLRNVEDLLFERGIDICHETVRMRAVKDQCRTKKAQRSTSQVPPVGADALGDPQPKHRCRDVDAPICGIRSAGIRCVDPGEQIGERDE